MMQGLVIERKEDVTIMSSLGRALCKGDIPADVCHSKGRITHYTHMHAHEHIHTHTTHICILMEMYTDTCTHGYTQGHTHIFMDTHMYIRTHPGTHTDTNGHTYIWTHTCTHMDTCRPTHSPTHSHTHTRAHTHTHTSEQSKFIHMNLIAVLGREVKNET